MRRLMLAAAMAACAVVPAAHADHCDDGLVIFSGQAEGPKPNANSLCGMLGEAAGDTRVINPGSSELVVRFARDFGATYPQITATIDGLGFANRTLTLTRERLTTGEWVYDSPDLALDPSKRGCVRAQLTAAWGGAAAGSTAFHTPGSSC